jgi:hypothetical protein
MIKKASGPSSLIDQPKKSDTGSECDPYDYELYF